MEREIPNCRPTRGMHLASEVTERQLAELAGNLVKEQDESKTKPWEEILIGLSLGLSSADFFIPLKTLQRAFSTSATSHLSSET